MLALVVVVVVVVLINKAREKVKIMRGMILSFPVFVIQIQEV
jgi:hypothetical protein